MLVVRGLPGSRISHPSWSRCGDEALLSVAPMSPKPFTELTADHVNEACGRIVLQTRCGQSGALVELMCRSLELDQGLDETAIGIIEGDIRFDL